jgi:hypothetical protein
MTPQEQADREERTRQARDVAAADTVDRARQAEKDMRRRDQVGSGEEPSPLRGAPRSPYRDDDLDEGRLLESLMRALRARASRRPMDLRS